MRFVQRWRTARDRRRETRENAARIQVAQRKARERARERDRIAAGERILAWMRPLVKNDDPAAVADSVDLLLIEEGTGLDSINFAAAIDEWGEAPTGASHPDACEVPEPLWPANPTP